MGIEDFVSSSDEDGERGLKFSQSLSYDGQPFPVLPGELMCELFMKLY